MEDRFSVFSIIRMKRKRIIGWGQGIGVGLILLAIVTAVALPILQRQSIHQADQHVHFYEIIETAWPRSRILGYLHKLPPNILVALPISALSIKDQIVSQPINALIMIQGPVVLSPLTFSRNLGHLMPGDTVINHTIAQEYALQAGQSILVSPLPGSASHTKWQVTGSIQHVSMTPENLWDGVNAVIWDPQAAFSLIHEMPRSVDLPLWIIVKRASDGPYRLNVVSTHLTLTKRLLVKQALRSVIINPGWVILSVLLWIIGVLWITPSHRQHAWISLLLGSAISLVGGSYVLLWRGALGFTLFPINPTWLISIESGLWVITWTMIGVLRRLRAPRDDAEKAQDSQESTDNAWGHFNPLE